MALDDISFSPVHCQNQTGKRSLFLLPPIWDFPFSTDAWSGLALIPSNFLFFSFFISSLKNYLAK